MRFNLKGQEFPSQPRYAVRLNAGELAQAHAIGGNVRSWPMAVLPPHDF